MRRAILAAGLAGTVLLPSGAVAQSMPGMNMPGQPSHQHASPAAAPVRKPTAKPVPKRAPRPAPSRETGVQSSDGHMDHRTGEAPEHAALPDPDQGAVPGMAMPGAPPQGHAAEPMQMDGAVETALPTGNLPAPAPPRDHYADRTYGADAMAASRAALPADHGGATFSQVLFNIAEYQARQGGDGYRWNGEAWFGGDING